MYILQNIGKIFIGQIFFYFSKLYLLEGTARYVGFGQGFFGPLDKKQPFMLFLLILGNVWCSAVTSVTLSSDLSNFKKI